MKMRYDDYIQNPMGRDNAVYSQREMYRALYTDKLDKIMVREAGKIDFYLYRNKDGRYFIHIKVPSEVVPKFYYDTVIEFYATDSGVTVGNTLKDYLVRFYSNDPSFVFTFAHAFIKNDLFIKELEPKMAKRAVEERAKEKNPKDLVGYVKSIYFAYLIIKNRGLMRKDVFDNYAKDFDLQHILSTIESASSKIEKRQQLGAEIDKKKKFPSKNDRVEQSFQAKTSMITGGAKAPRQTKVTNMSKSTKTVKRK